jgi:hypothetical protein
MRLCAYLTLVVGLPSVCCEARAEPIADHTTTDGSELRDVAAPLDDPAEPGWNDVRAPVADNHSEPGLPPFGFDDRPLSVNGVLGFGTPIGLAGAVVEYSPFARFAVGAGAGTNAVGPQATAFVRLRPVLWEKPERVFAISFEAAFSGGKYASEWSMFHAVPLEDPGTTFEVDPALWIIGEAQFEYESRSGFHLVLTGQGWAHLLNQGAARCRDSTGVATRCSERLPQGGDLPEFRVEVGYALP